MAATARNEIIKMPFNSRGTDNMKIAGVQMDVQMGDVQGNLDRIANRFRDATEAGAGLVVFPECAVTGYCFGDLDEARPFAQNDSRPRDGCRRQALFPSGRVRGVRPVGNRRAEHL